MTRTKITCPECGQEISKSNFTKHQRRHQNHPETFEIPKYRVEHDGLDCQFCGKTCKNRNSLCNHERQCKKNPDVQLSYFNIYNNEHTAWNKGLTKESDARIYSMACKLSEIKKFKIRSEETKLKISNTLKKNYQSGAIKRNPCNSKHARNYYGTYREFHCDSSWELAFVLYCLDHNIPIKRNHEFFEYYIDGQLHRYFPDFIINNTFIEIKGRCTKVDLIKFESFPKSLRLYVLKSAELKPCFQYCEDQYGKEFYRLYDRNYPSWMDRECI